jgi:hypothetical protein
MDGSAGDDRPLTPELLGDLQAGLLDDETAARLRRRIRSEPKAAHMLAALDRVRRDLAHLGTDEASAPDVPAAVTARIGAALHAARPAPRRHRIGLIAGLVALLLGVVVGAAMLLRHPTPTRSTGPTAEMITVSRTAAAMPLNQAQLLALLAQPPDYGLLVDPAQRASCLSGLGYPGNTAVLGARPVDAGEVMLLPTDTPATVLAVLVGPNCGPAHSAPLAHTVLTRP